MIVLDSRPKDDKFDDRLRGYCGQYCYEDEVSKWECTGYVTDIVWIRLILLFIPKSVWL